MNLPTPVTRWLDVNGEMLEKGLVEIDAVYKRSVAAALMMPASVWLVSALPRIMPICMISIWW